MIVVTPYLVNPVSTPSQLSLRTDDFVPAADADWLLLLRQRARGTGPDRADADFPRSMPFQTAVSIPVSASPTGRQWPAAGFMLPMNNNLRSPALSGSTLWRWGVALLIILLPAGCAGMNDPYQRAGTWRPTGANDTNIVAMASNPRDLVVGANDPSSLAQISAAAVRRLLTDNVKPLPSSAVGEVALQSPGAVPPSAGAGSGSGQ